MNEQMSEKKQEKVAVNPIWHKVEDAAFWISVGLMLLGLTQYVMTGGIYTIRTSEINVFFWGGLIGALIYVVRINVQALRIKEDTGGDE